MRRVSGLCADWVVAAVFCVSDNSRPCCVNSSADRIELYELNTRRHLVSIPAGIGPAGVYQDSQECKRYSANSVRFFQYDSTVTVTDADTDSVLRTMVMDRTPRYLCYNPTSGRAYCASRHGTLGMIDGQSDGVVRWPYVGQPRSDLLYDAAYDQVFSVNFGSSGIFVIDAASREHDPASILVDILGRKMMKLRPGPSDIRHLPTGVYVLHQQSAEHRLIVAKAGRRD